MPCIGYCLRAQTVWQHLSVVSSDMDWIMQDNLNKFLQLEVRMLSTSIFLLHISQWHVSDPVCSVTLVDLVYQQRTNRQESTELVIFSALVWTLRGLMSIRTSAKRGRSRHRWGESQGRETSLYVWPGLPLPRCRIQHLLNFMELVTGQISNLFRSLHKVSPHSKGLTDPPYSVSSTNLIKIPSRFYIQVLYENIKENLP